MSTVSKEIADKIIGDDGYYMNDPRVVKIVYYQNMWGGDSYALVYRGDDPMKYEKAEACRNVKVLWSA